MEPYCKSSSHFLSKTIYMQSIQNFIFPNTPVPQVYIFAQPYITIIQKELH